MNDNKVLNLFDRVDKYSQLMTMVRMFTDYSEDKFKKMDDLRIN
jgi:hypothetical protein